MLRRKSADTSAAQPPPSQPGNAPRIAFNYEDAFSRNIGWTTDWEQQNLRTKKIAVAGMGGVGGAHLLTLTRLGIGAFHIADMDEFELANFNRQMGATLSTLGASKVDALRDMALDINPEAEIAVFPDGVDEANIDSFLEGVDLFIDGFDFFVLGIRAKVFARCAELGIPAITAAPVGMGVAYLTFMPGGMTFEEYFRLEGQSSERQYVNFLVGLNPKGFHRAYLADQSRVDFHQQRVPSTGMACQLCAGIVGIEALKILLHRGGVRSVPHYRQFDAYRGKWHSGWLPGGNRNPLQALKRHIGYSTFAKMSAASRPREDASADTEIEQVLTLARWAPSGDNSQPWRLEITAPDSVTIHVHDQSDWDVYDYNSGQPTLLSAGMLLESIRIAATSHGKQAVWQYRHSDGHEHIIDVQLIAAPEVTPDPLIPYLKIRSVNRKPFQFSKITPEQTQALEATLGKGQTIEWHTTWRERLHESRLNGFATDIRLRIREAFDVHQKVLDWKRQYSTEGVPVTAIGLDKLTISLMRWAMKDWRRMNFLNRLPFGTLAARFQMDYLPGVACGAHFSLTARPAASEAGSTDRLLEAGGALQRFWLTATQLGLSLQPSLAPAIFSWYGAKGTDFSADKKAKQRARKLADALYVGNAAPETLVFRGRIGVPHSPAGGSRSVRKPLADLLHDK